eukprot:2639586-Ditylum_brightwellii.AAC.1
MSRLVTSVEDDELLQLIPHPDDFNDEGHNDLLILSQNINGIAIIEDLQYCMEDMKKKMLISRAQAKYIGNDIFNNFTLITSSSDALADYHQQVSTCMEITKIWLEELLNVMLIPVASDNGAM